MTVTNLWQVVKENASPIAISGLAVSTAASLLAFGSNSQDSAAQHTSTGQWAAWMGANLTEALRTGSNTTILYVIEEMDKMQHHCVNSTAEESASATVQNVFGAAFLIGAILYGGLKIKNALYPPQNTYQPLTS